MSQLEENLKRKLLVRQLPTPPPSTSESVEILQQQQQNLLHTQESLKNNPVSLDIRKLHDTHQALQVELQKANANLALYSDPLLPKIVSSNKIKQIFQKIKNKFKRKALNILVMPSIQKEQKIAEQTIRAINQQNAVLGALVQNVEALHNQNNSQGQSQDIIHQLQVLEQQLMNKILEAQEKDQFKLLSLMADYQKTQVTLEAILEKFQETKNQTNFLLSQQNISCSLELIQSDLMDYMDFEDTFRGSRDLVMKRQHHYISYFTQNHNQPILDIGCGRGEFLELMQSNGIPAYGIDLYAKFEKFCTNRGFQVIHSDALEHVSKLDDFSLGGIFMSHVVEHLNNDYLLTLLSLLYKKIKPGSYLILETPNPECLATYRTFNTDLTHFKPVHFATLAFFLTSVGFTHIERYSHPDTFYSEKANTLNITIEGQDQPIADFNQGMQNINNLVFGNLDYAIIARK